MAPTISPGAEVTLCCSAQPRVGDIIAYVRGDRLVVHRVVAVSGAGWTLTCGDALAVPDPPITDTADVIGVVTKVRRDGALADPPSPPRSLSRRLGVLACAGALRVSMPLGRRTIRALTLARRWGLALRGRGPVDPGGAQGSERPTVS